MFLALVILFYMVLLYVVCVCVYGQLLVLVFQLIVLCTCV